jgi:hypothetical protein
VVSYDQFMCRPHWFGLPKRHRWAVVERWRSYGDDPAAYARAHRAAIEWYEARDSMVPEVTPDA